MSNMSYEFMFTLMIFLHIIDDFCLQAFCLSNLKQKSFWEKNAPDEMYKSDYAMAIVIHGISWAFMIMLPIAIKASFDVNWVYWLVLLANAIIHSLVDDLKANDKKLNLIQDQMIHMIQILVTFAIMI